MWLLGFSVYEKCMRRALHISVNIHTMHGCMDEWLSISCWIKTLEQGGNILPVYVMFPWQRAYCCENAWRQGLYLFVRKNKSTKWDGSWLFHWSLLMCCWERWSVHKNIEDVHTNTMSNQTLLQVEMMNILCIYMETTRSVVVLWYTVESTSENACFLTKSSLQMILSA